MTNKILTTRRTALKAGLTAIAATTVEIPESHADIRPKAPGETMVLFLGGDMWHNPVVQEWQTRKILGKTGWRLVFSRQDRFVTPEVMKNADLMII